MGEASKAPQQPAGWTGWGPQQQPQIPQQAGEPTLPPPGWGPPAGPPPEPGKKNWFLRHKILTAALGVVALLIVAGIAGGSSNTKSKSSADTTTAPGPAATVTATVTQTEAATPTPAPTTAAAPTKAKAVVTPKPKPPAAITYLPISTRQWALIAKAPDKYIGKHYIVYGNVTQFDSATGDDTFRADVAASNTLSYGFFDGDNTLLTGNPTSLANVTQGDVFRAAVAVLGSYSYDTQIGGNTTVRQLQVDQIKVIGRSS